MEETILFPSPNWFLVSILGASEDGWLVYGGPGKTVVVLEPLSAEYDAAIDSDQRYKTHVISKAHKERVVCVDISSEWPEKRHFVTGSSDGAVKEWILWKNDGKWNIKSIHSHEAHAFEKEEIVGIGYSMRTHVISVGNFSNVVVWELNTNVTKTYNSFMKSFRSTCMSCSPHMSLVVAVGTKQGVIFVLDLNGTGKILYKVRGQDDEISQVSWCPQYEVTLQRSLNETIRKSHLAQRLEQIQNEPEPDLEVSGVEKKLPSDSFDESIVEEDDTFDIYKDHEANEFGHKKYQPEDIVVKVKDDLKKDDFLAECEKLKAQILKNKNEDEESIQSLVDAMDKAHVDEHTDTKVSEGEVTAVDGMVTGAATVIAGSPKTTLIDASVHIHKHLLASIGKQGSVRIWSKSGKIVASCVILVNVKNPRQVAYSPRGPHHASLCWHKPDTLLITDGKTQVHECNPLKIDCKNKLICNPVHSQHRRGLYCITSSAPRVQTDELLASPDFDQRWSVWTVAQDRYLVKYCVKTRKTLAKFGTCGGFLYDVTPCPYDAGKLAIGVGDGAVRIWETQTTGEEEDKLLPGDVYCYWHNVQGKILQCAWHPTRENLIAFSTAESRVGLIDISTKSEKPARVLQPALSCGVYSIAWGENMTLFAVGGGELVMYHANKPDEAPIPIHIEIEGQKWEPSVVNYSHHGLMVGSNFGGVAIFSGPGGMALAAKFVYTKMIYCMEWHPQQTSSSDEESQYKNLVAISSVDKINTIVILDYADKEGGGKQLTNFITLTGHTNSVLQLVWSPHRDGQLLSTSQDATVRVWDAILGTCVSIFAGHSGAVLGAAWCAAPGLAGRVMSGSGDCCLRLWDTEQHPASSYTETKREPRKRKNVNKKKKTFGIVADEEAEDDEENDVKDIKTDVKDNVTDVKDSEEHSETELDNVAMKVKQWRTSKRFLLPIISRQVTTMNMSGPRILMQKYLEKNKEIKNLLDITKEEDAHMYDLDFLKLFGTINEVNEVLDMECQNHLEQNHYDGYVMLMIFRGHIDSVIQFANENDLLDSFLLSIAPCVSFKYWKDVTQLYVAQIDRLAVKKQEMKIYEPKSYGGVYFRKAAALLSVHDVRGAVDVLVNGKLFKEAYVLCRCRHMDSIAEETLNKWCYDAGFSGNLMLSALINIVAGKITSAASVLRRSNEQEYLNLSAELAKSAGLNTFADYIDKKKTTCKEKSTEDQTDELLEELPTRIELLMKESKVENGKKTDVSEVDDRNGDIILKCDNHLNN